MIINLIHCYEKEWEEDINDGQYFMTLCFPPHFNIRRLSPSKYKHVKLEEVFKFQIFRKCRSVTWGIWIIKANLVHSDIFHWVTIQWSSRNCIHWTLFYQWFRITELWTVKRREDGRICRIQLGVHGSGAGAAPEGTTLYKRGSQVCYDVLDVWRWLVYQLRMYFSAKCWNAARGSSTSSKSRTRRRQTSWHTFSTRWESCLSLSSGER